MKNGLKSALFKKNLDILVLLIVSLVCSAFAFFNMFVKIDYRFYDMLLGAGKSVEEDEDLLLIDINDASIDDIGVWPWSRDIIADMLVRLREFGASTIVFDIEYLQKSGKALVPNAQEETDEAIEMTKQNLGGIISQFAEAAGSGMYSSEELQELSNQLVGEYVNPALDEIKISTENLARDNDSYFARAVQFFGNSWMTVNIDMANDVDDRTAISRSDSANDENIAFISARRYAADNFLLKNVYDGDGRIELGNQAVSREQKSYRGFYPARYEFIRFSQGLGVTNVVVDRDGTRRRIELLHHPDPEKLLDWQEEDGVFTVTQLDSSLYVPQLSFAPLLSYLDVQQLERTKHSLILRDARLPGSERVKDIHIPLDENGCMLINWSRRGYLRSFKHISALYLYELDRCEERIVKNLSNITTVRLGDSDGYDLGYYTQAQELLALYQQIREMRSSLLERCRGYLSKGVPEEGCPSDDEYSAFFELRGQFYEALAAYMASEAKDEFFAMLDAVAAAGMADEDTIVQVQSDYNSYFTGINKDYEAFISFYDELKEKLPNAFCLIGNSATSSTDLGVTPYERSYANLGTHANVVNTILQERFIRPLSVWYGMALAFVCALVIIVLTRRQGNSRKNVVELGYVLIPITVLVLLMVLFKIYIPLFIPLLLVISTYVAQLVLNFVAVEKDRSTLRRGMDAYVAPEVVNQIVRDPSKLRLGGENRTMTALFSDVKKFSGFTEMINNEEGESHGAVRLVAILNEYLGHLSDAIMDNQGTIDKYVGDEIVSFFGAPLDDPNHAFNACVAGIRMKQVEDEYNRKHFDIDHDIPMRLESRVGINTGDMVVGNMGTVKKINYTIMGNNVNLASRLEGTNKAYNSWIMCSESTWKSANAGDKEGLLVARTLDCVQVVNVKKPVQLYSILGLRDEVIPDRIEAAEIFNEGIRLYLLGSETPQEKKNPDELRQALRYFVEAQKCYPPDASSDIFIDRCKYFLANGLPAVWDGVYVMTSK